ncbi:hypothetical protein MIND_00992100 [Mycena indigotica]|uniref:Uncharacterized protein n=1 Tax=Mycena indigotica TaxID=2126181 RepID=A0A8H6VWJ8_9AGAR|nr:uncharacterized protein MIND_00992100 [Mycena indigotica]KAF7294556.1 hypothetical protein MIND_00992100 [Mycena indigotica]
MYCRSSLEGKKTFQEWFINEYGRERAQEGFAELSKPPDGKKSSTSKETYLYLAAVEFGISEQAMREYFRFAVESDLCAPPRAGPALKRRREEPLAEWNNRRHESILNGSKIPDIDWRVVRAIASSEMELGIEIMEEWRFDLEVFIQMLELYSPSTIIDANLDTTPEDKLGPYHAELAFQSQIFIMTISHMTWFSLALTFTTLKEKKLSSTSAIQDAYKTDRVVLWRLVLCLCFVSYLCSERWHRLAEMIAYRELSKLEPVVECKSQLFDTPFGQKLIKYAKSRDATFQGPEFVHAITYMDAKRLKLVPRNKATDWSYACTVVRSIGNTWRQKAVDKTPIRYWLTMMSMVNTDEHSPKLAAVIKEAERLRADYAEVGIETPTKDIARLLLFDEAWKQIDKILWRVGRGLERVREIEPRGAEHTLYLSNPESPGRVSPLRVTFFPMYREGLAKFKALGKSPPPSWGQPRALPPKSNWTEYLDDQFDFDLDPHLDPGAEMWMTSDPDTAPEEQADVGVGAETETQAVTEQDVFSTSSLSWADEVEEEFFSSPIEQTMHDSLDSTLMDWDDALPDYLPRKFSIGKKNFKIFLRVFTFKSSEQPDATQAMKTVRWSDFEKAMKRIGFGVSQSPIGLAVRFDPPAKMARSVVFHRPYLNSFITPLDLRRIVYCLGACYRWKASVFVRAATED